MLYWAVARVQRRAATREYIRVDDTSVVVEKVAGESGFFFGRPGQPSHAKYAFPRPWTRVELRGGKPAHWPSRLLFCSRGQSVEIGAFLTDGERRGLEDRLATLLADDSLSMRRLLGRN